MSDDKLEYVWDLYFDVKTLGELRREYKILREKYKNLGEKILLMEELAREKGIKLTNN